MKEKWILGYENEYKIREDGVVLSYKTSTVRKLKPKTNPKGYLSVNLGRDTYRLHRLVAQAFIDNPKDYPQVDHRDEDKTNNTVSNLRWCTDKMNKEYYHSSRPKEVVVKNSNYITEVSKPIIVDNIVYSSTSAAARFIADSNEGKKIENVRKELRNMRSGKRNYGTIYGHVIKEVV